MSEPRAFDDYVRRRLAPLRVRVDADGIVEASEGAVEVYGYAGCRPGSEAVATLPFLHGLAAQAPLELPFVETPSGRRAHIMVAPHADGVELLLVDATDEWRQQVELQQKANELDLLSQRQQRLVRELEAAQVELRQRRDEAEQASRQKSEFIARMSHEFRTPLTAIIGQARRLHTGDDGAEHTAAAIERGAVHLLNLVENLLDEAQLRSGRILIQPRPTDLSALLAEIGELFAPLAGDKGLGFTTRIADAVPQWLELDDLRLRQILINLLGNAIKYTERGAVATTADWRDGALHVAVQDDGPGISAAARDRIFRAFHRESADAPGAGLGLSISRSLAELMDGRIALESEPGRGTVVTVSLPAAVAQAPPQAPAGPRPRLLLAEDSFDIAELLTAALGESGFDCEHCATAQAALARCRAAAPDLVIVDRNLSDMDGFALTRRLRADGYAEPVLMLTASNLVEDRDRALAAGCDEFMVKSAGMNALLEATRRLVANRG